MKMIAMVNETTAFKTLPNSSFLDISGTIDNSDVAAASVPTSNLDGLSVQTSQLSRSSNLSKHSDLSPDVCLCDDDHHHGGGGDDYDDGGCTPDLPPITSPGDNDDEE